MGAGGFQVPYPRGTRKVKTLLAFLGGQAYKHNHFSRNERTHQVKQSKRVVYFPNNLEQSKPCKKMRKACCQ